MAILIKVAIPDFNRPRGVIRILYEQMEISIDLILRENNGQPLNICCIIDSDVDLRFGDCSIDGDLASIDDHWTWRAQVQQNADCK